MWFQLKIEHCPAQEAELLSEELEETGALSLTITDKNDNPVMEPVPGSTPLWDEIIIQALYAQAEEAQAVIDEFAITKPELHISLEVLEDKDWEREWMIDFKPMRFGQRLYVCPTWLTPPDKEAINLMLDPGLAFGTGTHATTSLCLTWLEQTNLHGKSVIDYGCGSGILSLAALKLGAEHVFAVDIDPQALEATEKNSQSNHIKPNQITIGTPESLSKKVDILIANILLEPLIALKQRFIELLNNQGFLVVSGILSQQVPILMEAYQGSFVSILQEQIEGWSLLVFTKNTAALRIKN